jgi:hypothetical protein
MGVHVMPKIAQSLFVHANRQVGFYVFARVNFSSQFPFCVAFLQNKFFSSLSTESVRKTTCLALRYFNCIFSHKGW